MLRRYAIAPEDLLKAQISAHEQGEEVIRYYHSHPGEKAAPSDRDPAEAAPGVSYLFVASAIRQLVFRRGAALSRNRSWTQH